MRNLIFVLFVVFGFGTSAAEVGDWFFLPRASVGYNIAQGTHFTLGADVGTYLTEKVSGGVGVYFAAGEHPSHDREIGGGPFVGFVQPLTEFLMFSAREEINYIDMYVPVKLANGSYTHVGETGVASATSVGLHIFLSKNFVVSGGYRLMVGLTNAELARDRSGTFFGLAVGI